jgi:hypothetical protein
LVSKEASLSNDETTLLLLRLLGMLKYKIQKRYQQKQTHQGILLIS